MESPICSIVPKGTVFKWDREPSGRTGTMNADQLLTDLGPGSTVGNKGRKRGQIWSNRKNIGERNEPSGGLGREKGRPPPFPVSTLPLGSASSSGASFFAWQRRARNEWLVMNRKGCLLPAFLCAHIERDVWVRGSSGLASFADIFFRPRRFFSPSFPNAKPGPRLITSQCRDAPLTSSKTKTQAY